MIHLAGSARRSFLFPGDIQTALNFYADMGRLFQYLPYIKLIKTYSNSQFRVRFQSTELGIYRIELYSDLEVTRDESSQQIKAGLLNGIKPVKSKAGMHSIRGMTAFTSISKFQSEGDQTRIYYHLNLEGQLLKPLAFNLIPDHIADHIAESIAKRRIFEIADGFITGSLKEFRKSNGLTSSK
jgi:hypothetical protein